MKATTIMIIAHLHADQNLSHCLHKQMMKKHEDRKKDMDKYSQKQED